MRTHRRQPHARDAGLLLHLTSLPGPGGVGDLGPEAYRFLEQMHRAGQRLWQVLPLGPTGYGDSPYQSLSAFAGNPLLISLELLRDDGLLQPGELAGAPPSGERADYGAAQAYRLPLLERAAERLGGSRGRLADEFAAFCAAEGGWLEDYALFMALKEEHGLRPWHAWAPPVRDRHPAALEEARRHQAPRLHFYRFTQWAFFRQWQALRHRAGELGIGFLGDMPIFVAHDSVEVWAEREQFLLHPDGRLKVQAGVPPDYFSATGQLWGNPLYDWARMERDGFVFWRRRVAHACALYDRVRIDHFRGFAAHWEVPGDAEDARAGRWVEVPGTALFSALYQQLGDRLDLIAEDLGVITDDVERLRDRFGLPGMRVLQFAFGDAEPDKVRPYGFPRNLVVYTSTHDNDTFVGWFRGSDHVAQQDGGRREQRAFLEYVGLREEQAAEVHWAAVRLAYGTVADTVVVPVQDVLGQGSDARMNRPGMAAGNWGYRLLPGQLHDEALTQLRDLARIYGRLGPPLPDRR